MERRLLISLNRTHQVWLRWKTDAASRLRARYPRPRSQTHMSVQPHNRQVVSFAALPSRSGPGGWCSYICAPFSITIKQQSAINLDPGLRILTRERHQVAQKRVIYKLMVDHYSPPPRHHLSCPGSFMHAFAYINQIDAMSLSSWPVKPPWPCVGLT